MKKQIFTLVTCFALSANTTLAIGIQAVAQKTVPHSFSAQQINTPATPNFVKPGEQPKFISKEEAKKHFEDAKTKERELLYAALNLSAEQKIKAEALDAKTRTEGGKYLRQLQVEFRKLRNLKAKHASFFAIYKQKIALKKAKSEAHKYFESSRKSFEAILTKEQRAKFKLIDNAKKEEMKQFRKKHHHTGNKKSGYFK